jgi:hypothetical protein
LCPWVDIDKLHSIYAGTGVRRTRPRSYSKQPATAKNAIPCTSAKPLEPTSVHNEEKLPCARKNLSDPPVRRKSTSHTKNNSGLPPKPPLKTVRRASISAQRRLSSFHDPTKSSEVIKDQVQRVLYEYLDTKKPEERNLSSVIKKWSNEPDGKLRPLQMLLFEAPVLLPPNNPLVEHHEYFDKWKTLHRDAFKDGEGMDTDAMVVKVARRCKVFLHPDKWPTDLSDDQKFLLQSIWDTLSGSELF